MLRALKWGSLQSGPGLYTRGHVGQISGRPTVLEPAPIPQWRLARPSPPWGGQTDRKPETRLGIGGRGPEETISLIRPRQVASRTPGLPFPHGASSRELFKSLGLTQSTGGDPRRQGLSDRPFSMCPKQSPEFHKKRSLFLSATPTDPSPETFLFVTAVVFRTSHSSSLGAVQRSSQRYRCMKESLGQHITMPPTQSPLAPTLLSQPQPARDKTCALNRVGGSHTDRWACWH